MAALALVLALAPPLAPARAAPLMPPWFEARGATVLVDSVLLGGQRALRRALPRWRIRVIGRPAIMIRMLDAELRASRRRMTPLVVLGVGYNSLWERSRRNYRLWAADFDRRARGLLGTLRRRGARQFVWVTLRDAPRDVIPLGARTGYDTYSWYFPYVNERLRRLARSRPDVVLADWAAVSAGAGLTYDNIHLNAAGAALMARTIRQAIGAEARRQARPAPARAGKGGPRAAGPGRRRRPGGGTAPAGAGADAPGGAGAAEQSEIQVPTASGIVGTRRLTAILDLNPWRRTSAPGSSDLTERINAGGRPGRPGDRGRQPGAPRILAA
jgi:lysophospholipase L1-like esterase